MSHPHRPAPPPYVGGHGPSYATPPPRQSRTGQVVAIAVLSVVALLGFVAAAVLFVTGGEERPAADESAAADGGEAPEESAGTAPTADPGEAGLVALGGAYADAINRADSDAATALTCDGADPGHLYTLVVGDSTDFTADDAHVEPGSQSGSMDLTYPESVGPYAFSGYYEDGRWCTDPF